MTQLNLSSITLPDELHRALIHKVESGEFPSREAVIAEALRSFLVEEPDREVAVEDRVTGSQPGYSPGPFILDELPYGLGDIPRSGGEKIRCRFLHDATRWPDRFPGE